MVDTGRGAGGPCPHPHVHTEDKKKNFVLLTLLALDVQTLRKSYEAGFATKAINSSSALTLTITNAICIINTIFLPRSARRKHILPQDPLCATVIDFMLLLAFPLLIWHTRPLNTRTQKWACPRVKFSHMHIFNFCPSSFNSWIRPWGRGGAAG